MTQLIPSQTQTHLLHSPNKFTFHHHHHRKFSFHSCNNYNKKNNKKAPKGNFVVNKFESSHAHQALVEESPLLLPHVQTLTMFPKDDLLSKLVMLRFDSTLLLSNVNLRSPSMSTAILTINYLCQVGAKVILVSDWNTKVLDIEFVADILSSILHFEVATLKSISPDIQLRIEALKNTNVLLLDSLSLFKEEVANCSTFAELLSSGVDIFVNDSFSLSRKILASTVAVTRFCSANIAGFHFEESIHLLKEAAKTDRKPYIAIIGGGNLYDKADALHFLASKCDGIVFVGMMAFQIMHALGLHIPLNLLEPGASKATLDFIKFAHDRNIPIVCPKDFWCTNNVNSNQLKVLAAHDIRDGWLPVDLGPRSLDEMNSFIRNCKKLIWIGPVKFKLSSENTKGASRLSQILVELSKTDCKITVVGNAACNEMLREPRCSSVVSMVDNASVVWEFFKGRKLPAVTALDRAYPFKIDWTAAYSNPTQPLLVDIGSGNGMFVLGMARQRKDLNFLGLEMNKKLVKRCLDALHQSGIANG